MDSLDPTSAVGSAAVVRPPGVWKFWGTALWGLIVFAAMFAGQMAVVAWFMLLGEAPLDMDGAIQVVSRGLTISLSVITGLPAVLAPLWIATRMKRTSLGDYLALRGTSWINFLVGVVALAVLVMGWEVVSRAVGHEVTAGFMGGVLQSARADGALWVLVLAFCVAAPISEELFARGFLYRGWSETFLGPGGAILLSSMVWTALHLQYDWFFLGEVFSIGVLLGYLRYRFKSTWLTIFVHGVNNLAAVTQTILIAGS